MSNKLKMKPPKQNRRLVCDNQMQQAFGRAIQNSKKELEEMCSKAYMDGLNEGDNWSNVVNSITVMLALRELYGFSTKRLLDVIHTANKYIQMANNGEKSVAELIEDLERETDVRIPEDGKKLVEKFGV